MREPNESNCRTRCEGSRTEDDRADQRIAARRLLSRKQFVGGSATALAAATALLGSFGSRGGCGCSESLAMASAAADSAAAMKPGTYEATVQGHNGNVTVSVTVSEDSIEDIQIGDNSETYFVGTHTMDSLAQEMLDQQTPNVDTVSGATFSSLAVKNGVEQALEQAGATADEFPEAVEDEPAQGDTTTQIVVIGSGSGGLAAAMSAFQQGHDVILLEQLGIIGGASGRAGYYVGGGTRAAAAAGDNYSMEDFRDMLVENNPDQADLATLMGERAGESIDWLCDLGLTDIYYDTSGVYGHGTHWGDYGHIGGWMTYAMQTALDENGIDYRLNSKVSGLIVDGGKVCGVQVEPVGGDPYEIRCDAVIIATGGYARNNDMVDQYTPELSGYSSDSTMGADGSGMLMAADAGAALDNMSDVFYYYGENVMYLGVPRNITYPYLLCGPIVVNEQGERFINELNYYARETVDAFNEQSGRHGYIILTQAMADAVIKPALDYSSNLAAFYIACDTMDDVAQTLGIDAEALEATVERYNSFVDAGSDEDFGKDPTGLSEKFVEGPFYVAEVAPCVHMTYGGIRTDLSMRVLDENDEPIPGLYAVGECTHVMLNGIGTNTIALVEGRVAAESVAADLL
jgi:fumarate reductase flavoprotein subunit